MGITDFGLNGTGQSQPYGTNEFLGVASIISLPQSGIQISNVCAIAGGSLSLQLNVVLVFWMGNTPYYYWIQDVAVFDTQGSSSSSTVTYTDDVWNFSSPSLQSQSVASGGNGSLQVDEYGRLYYASCAPNSLNGNGVQLNYSTSSPASVKLQVNAVVSGNVPHVVFSYYSTRTGAREVFDNVWFPWAVSPNFPQFTVSAVGADPNNGFNDAEFVFGGPCEGCQITFQEQSKVQLFLEFDFLQGTMEYVPNAYDFGGDTAELANWVYDSGLEAPVGASLYYDLGTLGMLYWSNSVQFHTNSTVPQSLEWELFLSGPNLVTNIAINEYFTNGATTLPDGVYSWQILPPAGWVATPSSGSVTVSQRMNNVFFSLTDPGGGGGGGCVAYGTPILTPQGYVPVQKLERGAPVVEFNFTTQTLTGGVLQWANKTRVTSLVDIDNGRLFLTPTDQPIFIRNSTFMGWLRDPKNLTEGDYTWNPINDSWVLVTNVSIVQQQTFVYDVVTSGLNNFVANGFLLDQKKPG